MYLLLPIFMLVWGLIAFRVLKLTKTSEAFKVQAVEAKELSIPTKLKRKKLSLDYTDPFGLGTKKPNPLANKVNSPVRKRLVKWPELKFIGQLKPKGSKKQITIISIDQQQHLFSLNQQIANIKLKKIWKDSVKLSYQDSLIKVIYK
jgi:hypothetical protein